MAENDITTRMVERHMEALYEKSSSQSYFTELRLGTGFENEQRLDGFLMELWPSKKYEITAFEIKISRSDFLSELKKPKKRQAGLEISNNFYFVTANKIVNDIKEIPPECGWYEFTGGRLKLRKKAPHRVKPEACPWTLMASVFRRCEQKIKKQKQKNIAFKQSFSDLMED